MASGMDTVNKPKGGGWDALLIGVWLDAGHRAVGTRWTLLFLMWIFFVLYCSFAR